MGKPLKKLSVHGFKSMYALENFQLRSVNILIGANGAGKSNFVCLFTILRDLVQGHLQLKIAKKGGADATLFMGPKVTKQLKVKLEFSPNSYAFTLEPTIDNRFVFAEERIGFDGDTRIVDRNLGSGHTESMVPHAAEKGPYRSVARYIWETLSDWIVYHFHDTSDSAGVRRSATVRDNEALRPDASNLASFLLMLKEAHPERYELIRDTVRLVAPFFDDFRLRPKANGDDSEVLLEWSQSGSDYPFHPSQFSDGTLRFICLATALLQPDPPATMLFDEPELGLHPTALSVLAGLLKKASADTQLIISTQSALLLDNFEPEDVIVVNRVNGKSEFVRLNQEQLSDWLETYSLGELWQKNVVEGGPTNG